MVVLCLRMQQRVFQHLLLLCVLAIHGYIIVFFISDASHVKILVYTFVDRAGCVSTLIVTVV